MTVLIIITALLLTIAIAWCWTLHRTAAAMGRDLASVQVSLRGRVTYRFRCVGADTVISSIDEILSCLRIVETRLNKRKGAKRHRLRSGAHARLTRNRNV